MLLFVKVQKCLFALSLSGLSNLLFDVLAIALIYLLTQVAHQLDVVAGAAEADLFLLAEILYKAIDTEYAFHLELENLKAKWSNMLVLTVSF